MSDAIYARYSSHNQDEGTSIEIQLDACHRAASGECLEFIDRARTGRAVAGRVALRRLMESAARGEISRLFIYKYDRLGRNMAEVATFVSDLEDLEIEVISATEGQDTLARGIHLVVAEHYSLALAERTLDGLKKRFEQRAWTGGTPPYGYKVVSDEQGVRRIAIDPAEAEMIQVLFDLYLGSNIGLKELAQAMASKGYLTRRSATWCHTTVRGILTNPVVTGTVRFNRRRIKLNRKTGRRVPRRKNDADVMSYHDEKLRIISQEDFERSQKRFVARSKKSGGRTARSANATRPLTGLMFCDECGNVFYNRVSRNHKGEYRYYNCGRRQRSGPQACSNKTHIREDIFLMSVHQTYQAIFDDVDAIASKAVEEAKELLSSNRDEADRLRGLIAECDSKIDLLTTRLIDPEIVDAAKRALSQKLGEVQQERERHQGFLEALTKRAEESVEKLAREVMEALDEARQSLASVSTPSQMNEFISKYVGPMIVRADGSIGPKKKSGSPDDVDEPDVPGLVAGGGFEPPTSGL